MRAKLTAIDDKIPSRSSVPLTCGGDSMSMQALWPTVRRAKGLLRERVAVFSRMQAGCQGTLPDATTGPARVTRFAEVDLQPLRVLTASRPSSLWCLHGGKDQAFQYFLVARVSANLLRQRRVC